MKTYFTIGNLCIGLGRPPADLWAQRLAGRPRFSLLRPRENPKTPKASPSQQAAADAFDRVADAIEQGDR